MHALCLVLIVAQQAIARTRTILCGFTAFHRSARPIALEAIEYLELALEEYLGSPLEEYLGLPLEEYLGLPLVPPARLSPHQAWKCGVHGVAAARWGCRIELGQSNLCHARVLCAGRSVAATVDSNCTWNPEEVLPPPPPRLHTHTPCSRGFASRNLEVRAASGCVLSAASKIHGKLHFRLRLYPWS